MIDLDPLWFQLAKQCNGRVLRAEIIQCHIDPHIFKIFKIIPKAVGIRYLTALCKLQDQLLLRCAGFFHDPCHHFSEAFLKYLDIRNIHGNYKIRILHAPQGRLGKCLIQKPLSHLSDGSVFLQDRNKFHWGNQGSIRQIKTHQSLSTINILSLSVHQRLVYQCKPSAIIGNRLTENFLQSEFLHCFSVHLSGKLRNATTSHFLRLLKGVFHICMQSLEILCILWKKGHSAGNCQLDLQIHLPGDFH